MIYIHQYKLLLKITLWRHYGPLNKNWYRRLFPVFSLGPMYYFSTTLSFQKCSILYQILDSLQNTEFLIKYSVLYKTHYSLKNTLFCTRFFTISTMFSFILSYHTNGLALIQFLGNNNLWKELLYIPTTKLFS